MPTAGGGMERRRWVVRYRGHRRVPCTGGAAGASLFVPTESEAARVGADGKELPFFRFKLEGLNVE